MSGAIPLSNTGSLDDLIQQKIEHEELHVPVLPEIANKVLSLTQDPDSSAGELSQLIQGDQTLAAHVMRIANSAAYSPNATIVSLQQATARLGMHNISEIALAATINSNLFKTPGYETYVSDILKSSLATGLWAKEVARVCRKNVESAFLAGLLVDIGRPVLVQTVLEATMAPVPPEEMSRLELGFQRSIGAKVISSWKMPASILKTIEQFDNYEQSTDAQTQIIAAANALETHTRGELTKEEILSFPAFALLNLYQDEAEALLEKADTVKSTQEAMSQHG